MGLPLSSIVKVDISVAPTKAPLAGLGEMLFLTNDKADLDVVSFVERQRKFSSLTEVQDTFPATSEAIVAATAFFSQTPTPDSFTVGVMVSEAMGATLVGGTTAPLEALKGVVSGGFTVTVDGAELVVSGLDLADATSYADVAKKIDDVLGTEATTVAVETEGRKARAARALVKVAKCTYNGRFMITSLTSGGASSITSLSNDGDFAYMLGLSEDSYLALEAGRTDPETVSQALGECADVSDSFVAVVLHKGLRDSDEHISSVNGAAAWCEASEVIFLNTTNDRRIFGLKAEQDETEASKLLAKAFSKTITTYGRSVSEYPSASLFGRIATVNYEGRNTCITLKFKKLPGITALNLKTSEKAKMDALRVGGFMDFGGNLMYAEGRMADGTWIDNVHGLLWLKDRIQKGVFNLLNSSTTKIPYTDTGVNMVVQKVTTALEQGVANGLIAAGFTPEGEFLPNGYRVIAASSTQVSAEDKSNRLYRGISFVAVGAGALHNVVVNGSFSE